MSDVRNLSDVRNPLKLVSSPRSFGRKSDIFRTSDMSDVRNSTDVRNFSARMPQRSLGQLGYIYPSTNPVEGWATHPKTHTNPRKLPLLPPTPNLRSRSDLWEFLREISPIDRSTPSPSFDQRNSRFEQVLSISPLILLLLEVGDS